MLDAALRVAGMTDPKDGPTISTENGYAYNGSPSMNLDNGVGSKFAYGIDMSKFDFKSSGTLACSPGGKNSWAVWSVKRADIVIFNLVTAKQYPAQRMQPIVALHV